MRPIFLGLMLLLPAAAIAYHYGPGQSRLALDNVSIELRSAEAALRKEQFTEAIAAFDAALEFVPGNRPELAREIRLERAKAKLQNRGLAEAFDELTALKEEVDAAGTQAKPEFANDLRKTMANAQYYMTWLQRLEGEPRSAWEPDIEAARQNYKLLADAAHKAGDESQAVELERDLEAAIRLARLDLSELQALPLPKQCQGCCSGNCKCKGKGNKRGQKQGQNRPEDARGAGSGPPPDEKGS